MTAPAGAEAGALGGGERVEEGDVLAAWRA
jgi:hypothetical protein